MRRTGNVTRYRMCPRDVERRKIGIACSSRHGGSRQSGRRSAAARCRAFILSACVWALVFVQAPCLGQLPPLTASQMADLIELHQGQLKRMSAKYALVYGSMQGTDNDTFVPKDPAYKVTAQSSIDFEQGVEHLKQDQFIKGEHYILECAFDGNVGTQLESRPPKYKPFGVITDGPARELQADTMRHLTPAEVTYWPVAGQDLAGLVRRSDRIDIEQVTDSGLACYRVTVRLKRERLVEYKGRQVVGIGYDLLRLWLAPDRGMLPLRIEKLSTSGPADMKGKLDMAIVVSDFRSLDDGVWFPFSARQFLPRIGHSQTVVEMSVDSVVINEDAAVPRRVKFPKGAHVTDDIVRTKYRVGSVHKRQRRYEIEQLSNTIQEKQEGQRSLKNVGTEANEAIKTAPVGEKADRDGSLGTVSPIRWWWFIGGGAVLVLLVCAWLGMHRIKHRRGQG